MIHRVNIKKAFLAFVFLGSFISCSDDDNKDNPEPTPSSKTKYVIAFQENKVGEAEEVDYMLAVNSLEDLKKGELSVEGKGTPLKSWSFFHQTGNTLFSSGGYGEDEVCRSFVINKEGKLAPLTKFSFDKAINFFKSTNDGKMIGISSESKGLSKKSIRIVDPKTGKVDNIIEHNIDLDKGDGTPENPGSIPWVSGLIQRGDKVFVSYMKILADGTYKTPDTDRAYVAVFKYPEFEFEKIIYDDRTSPIGINGHNTGLIESENGDIYSSSSSALSAGYTAVSKPSGILKIKKGATEFDKDYFFDVENADNGGKLYWMDYVGNGKAIARLILDDTKGAYEWGSFLTDDALKLVILDLNKKTVTDISGIANPNGQRYTAPVYKENGKVYISVSDKTETRIYEVDPVTATATKGAKAVNAKSIKGIFKLTSQE